MNCELRKKYDKSETNFAMDEKARDEIWQTKNCTEENPRTKKWEMEIRRTNKCPEIKLRSQFVLVVIFLVGGAGHLLAEEKAI